MKISVDVSAKCASCGAIKTSPVDLFVSEEANLKRILNEVHSQNTYQPLFWTRYGDTLICDKCPPPPGLGVGDPKRN